MTIQPDHRGARHAVFILLLAASAIAHESRANPVLFPPGEESVADTSGDEVSPRSAARPEGRMAVTDPPTLPLPVVIDEIRVDERAPGRRPGWTSALPNSLAGSPGLPGGYGGVFGQGETLREQFLRDFRSATAFPGPEPAAVPDPSRRDAAQNLVDPTQFMLREAVDNSLRLVRDSIVEEIDVMGFSVTGIDFFFAIGGGPRPSMAGSESGYWSTMPQLQLFDDVRPEKAGRASLPGNAQGVAFFGGSGNTAENPPAVQPDHAAPLLMQRLREFFTDATTIAVALGCLCVWFAYEMTSAIRERRRMRRIRRRGARARS